MTSRCNQSFTRSQAPPGHALLPRLCRLPSLPAHCTKLDAEQAEPARQRVPRREPGNEALSLGTRRYIQSVVMSSKPGWPA